MPTYEELQKIIQGNLSELPGPEVFDPLIKSNISETNRLQNMILPMLSQIQSAGKPTKFDKITKGLTAVAAIADLTSGNKATRRDAPFKFQQASSQNKSRIQERVAGKRQELNDKLALEEIFGKRRASLDELLASQAEYGAKAKATKIGAKNEAAIEGFKIEAEKAGAEFDKRKADIDAANKRIDGYRSDIQRVVSGYKKDAFSIAQKMLENQEITVEQLAERTKYVYDQLVKDDDSLSDLNRMMQLTEWYVEAETAGAPADLYIFAKEEEERQKKIEEEAARGQEGVVARGQEGVVGPPTVLSSRGNPSKRQYGTISPRDELSQALQAIQFLQREDPSFRAKELLRFGK